MAFLGQNPATRLPAPGDRLGPYRLGEALGAGGMGMVFAAEHVELGKRVAVKLLRPDRAGDEKRFAVEGRAAGRMNHPHVVDVYDVGTQDGIAFLVMERLEGRDLAALIDAEGALTPERAVAILLPIVSAVQAAHEAGIVHRDLKPSNLFVAREATGRERPVVLDFGISKLARLEGALLSTASTQVVGTPSFMAPEQARSAKHAGPAADQYALGVVLYYALTAALPFQGESIYEIVWAIQNAIPPAPSALAPSLPAALDAVVLRAMEREPSARFPDVRALGAALLPFADPLTRALWERELAPTAGAACPDPPAAAPRAEVRAPTRPTGREGSSPAAGSTLDPLADTEAPRPVASDAARPEAAVARAPRGPVAARAGWIAVAGTLAVLSVASLTVALRRAPGGEPTAQGAARPEIGAPAAPAIERSAPVRLDPTPAVATTPAVGAETRAPREAVAKPLATPAPPSARAKSTAPVDAGGPPPPPRRGTNGALILP